MTECDYSRGSYGLPVARVAAAGYPTSEVSQSALQLPENRRIIDTFSVRCGPESEFACVMTRALQRAQQPSYRCKGAHLGQLLRSAQKTPSDTTGAISQSHYRDHFQERAKRLSRSRTVTTHCAIVERLDKSPNIVGTSAEPILRAVAPAGAGAGEGAGEYTVAAEGTVSSYPVLSVEVSPKSRKLQEEPNIYLLAAAHGNQRLKFLQHSMYIAAELGQGACFGEGLTYLQETPASLPDGYSGAHQTLIKPPLDNSKLLKCLRRNTELKQTLEYNFNQRNNPYKDQQRLSSPMKNLLKEEFNLSSNSIRRLEVQLSGLTLNEYLTTIESGTTEAAPITLTELPRDVSRSQLQSIVTTIGLEESVTFPAAGTSVTFSKLSDVSTLIKLQVLSCK